MNLDELKKNQIAIVKKIKLKGEFKERLHSLGLIEGVKISFIRNSVFDSPKVFHFLNTFVALRDTTAKKIEIELY